MKCLPWDRGRLGRIGESGQDACGPSEDTDRIVLPCISWDRGSLGRIGESGQDARGPREDTLT